MSRGSSEVVRPLDSSPAQPRKPADVAANLATLVVDLQARGLRVEVPLERRQGGAGPSDSGMLWVGGFRVTAPTDNAAASDSPYVLKAEDDGYAIFRGTQRLAAASAQQRPRFYDLSTADGIPYWKIGLLHLDSFASTVVQTCAYWGKADQCRFCGIGVSLDAGRTIVKKTPEQLAEVASAAKELDGAVDATLTTGSSNGVDRGARYVARCGHAVKEATGLPVEVQFEPPLDLDVIDEVHALGIDSVGIHVESFDPQVLAHVAPAKARTGIDYYFRAWERAVALFGEGQVSTYVILGMGEDPELTVAGCRRAVDIGVFPFVVPIRPVAGSLMADVVPPEREYTERIYRKVAAYMTARGMDTSTPKAGCARCQACSALSSVQSALQIGARPIQIAGRPAGISSAV
ncbi:MAG TPA: MSMEG_0568 family radical SAM protein [Jatrophihabitantaceae bacterium]|nr:MSMEG_0568 family radical SAM protein [Jatrophihabitantaceae bacterium]